MKKHPELNPSNPTPFWSAYRLSDEELEKMNTLKKLFENSGYLFNPNRFPEIYYENYDVIRPNLGTHLVVQQEITNNPDYLGVYLFVVNNGEDDWVESKEGKIILFKDRIEEYCSRHNVSEDSVRFMVLMHELGHWLSHWALNDQNRWNLGFHFPITRTHEALAQLIAYWACEDNPTHLDSLYRLSPKNSKGEIDENAIYGGYIKLVGLSKVMVLKKLSDLRRFWMLKDEKLYEFLISEQLTVEDWMQTLILENPENPFYKFVVELNLNSTDLAQKLFKLRELSSRNVFKEFKRMANHNDGFDILADLGEFGF
jgi:hypothetical protein